MGERACLCLEYDGDHFDDILLIIAKREVTLLEGPVSKGIVGENIVGNLKLISESIVLAH